jgi:predicted NAD/FAD-binding protein
VHDHGERVSVDSGFIVHNERTYPTLVRLFAELGVATQDSDMSMSVRCQGCGLEYAGARGPTGVLARPNNLTNPRYLRMLAEIPRFHRHAATTLRADRGGEMSLGAFTASGRYSAYFVDHFLIPLVSAVWSAGEHVSPDYPAAYLFEFLANHGMLSIGGSPQWRTVTGGSATYVERVAARLHAVRIGCPVRAVSRTDDGVQVRDDAGRTTHADVAVIATHADQALALLPAATAAEKEVLGAFTYSRNEALLHTDGSLLPRWPAARASWNYVKQTCASRARLAVLSYDLNRLMRLPVRTPHVVTLNAAGAVDPRRVLARMIYHHPVYTGEALAAQRRLPELDDHRLAFAGAYHGWGFHEDGCASGVRAAAALGVPW